MFSVPNLEIINNSTVKTASDDLGSLVWLFSNSSPSVAQLSQTSTDNYKQKYTFPPIAIELGVKAANA